MTDREILVRRFLEETPWARARRNKLAGDASNRKYERLTDPVTGGSAVLMDAPPDSGEDIRPFVRIARHLRDLGLSAPDILLEDPENGFLLLEDLGDDLFARVIPDQPDLEATLYETATDVLVALHESPLPTLENYGPRLMSELAGLALTKYRDGILGGSDPALHTRFLDRFEDVLRQTTPGDPVLIQRDYHAENLLWLPERAGVAQVGLLDFQDAMSGHRAYDLVSLLQDARRDVPAGIEFSMIARYIENSGTDEHAFGTAYAALGAQRNLRILGVFARLALERGKPDYVDLIPRVWSHLMRDLEHPALAPVSDLLRDTLPVPTAEHLQRLKRA